MLLCLNALNLMHQKSKEAVNIVAGIGTIYAVYDVKVILLEIKQHVSIVKISTFKAA